MFISESREEKVGVGSDHEVSGESDSETRDMMKIADTDTAASVVIMQDHLAAFGCSPN